MKKITPVLALILSAFATSAFAAEAPSTGFYVGASLGVPNTNIPNANQSGTTNNSDLAYSLLGGYQFTKNVATELQYSQLGSVKANTGSVVISAYNVSLIGSYPLNEKVSALARLGYGNTNLLTNDPVGANKKQSSVTYGIGAQYQVDARVAVRMTYDGYSVGDSTIPEGGTTRVLSVGGLYSF